MVTRGTVHGGWLAGFEFTRCEANKHCIVTIHECLNCRKLKHVCRVLIHLFYRLYFVLFLSSFEFHQVYKIPHGFFILGTFSRSRFL